MSPWLIAGLVIGGLILLFIILGAVAGASTPPVTGKFRCNADGTCTADAKGAYTHEECLLQCPLPCAEPGTASANADGTCVCKQGYGVVGQNTKCELCAAGYGPGYPCCDRQQMQWGAKAPRSGNDSDYGMNIPCVGAPADDNPQNQAARQCLGASGCNSTATWTGGYKDLGGRNFQFQCEQWVWNDEADPKKPPIPGAPVGHNANITDDRQYRSLFAEYVKAKKIIPGDVWCQPFPPADNNSTQYQSNCVAGYAHTCNLDTGVSAQGQDLSDVRILQ